MTTAPVAQDLAVRLVEFVGALRSKGIPAGTSETTDAAAVIDVLGMSDRSLLREGLASALVRRGGQRDVFDMTFDLYFPAGVGASQAARELDEDFDLDDLRDLLAMALAEDDLRTLEQVAEIAVDLLGRVGEAGPTGGWSAYQTLERLRPQTLLVQALGQRGEGGGSGPGQGLGQGGDFTARIERDEVRQNIDRFRAMVAGEARRRTAELRGRDVVTRHAVRANSDRIDFLSANRQQLEELGRTVRPLARKLATRLAARRLDLRRQARPRRPCPDPCRQVTCRCIRCSPSRIRPDPNWYCCAMSPDRCRASLSSRCTLYMP